MTADALDTLTPNRASQYRVSWRQLRLRCELGEAQAPTEHGIREVWCAAPARLPVTRTKTPGALRFIIRSLRLSSSAAG
jgi:hypothetical protein